MEEVVAHEPDGHEAAKQVPRKDGMACSVPSEALVLPLAGDEHGRDADGNRDEGCDGNVARGDENEARQDGGDEDGHARRRLGEHRMVDGRRDQRDELRHEQKQDRNRHACDADDDVDRQVEGNEHAGRYSSPR